MKLLSTTRAPNPRRVEMFLAEKGVELPSEDISLVKGEHKSEDFKAINPARTVPVLVLDDGTAIAETMAICRYLEALHPEPNLFGDSPLEQAQIEMWNRRAELMLLMPLAQAIRHGVPGLKVLEPNQIAEWAELSRDRAMKMMGWFDQQLADREFIAGDRFTVADITAFVGLEFGKVGKMYIPEECANLTAWRNRIAERASAVATSV